jgi:hypothetical protein
MEEMHKFQQMTDLESLNRKRIVDGFMKETRGLDPIDRVRSAEIFLNNVEDTYERDLIRKAIIKRFKELDLSNDERFLRSKDAKTRARYLMSALGRMDRGERDAYWAYMVDEGILTPGVKGVEGHMYRLDKARLMELFR